MSKYQVMPPLSKAERDSLKEQIEEYGVTDPVLVSQHGDIIDGHNRVEIAKELGIDYPTREISGTDEKLRDLAYTRNSGRRNLSTQQKRELIARSLKDDPGKSDREHAKRVGVDHKTVTTVRRDLEANGEIPHYAPGDRQEASGRKARGAAQQEKRPTPKKKEAPAEPAPPKLPESAPEPLELDEPEEEPEEVLTAKQVAKMGVLAVNSAKSALEYCESLTLIRYDLVPKEAREESIKELVAARDKLTKLIHEIRKA